jgi:hypothetical protein
MKKISMTKYLLTICLIVSTITVVKAQNQTEDQKTRFRESANLEIPTIKIPTVVEVSLPKRVYQVASFDDTSKKFVPNLLKTTSFQTIPSESLIVGTNNYLPEIIDDNYQTFYEFNIPEEGRGKVAVSIKYPKVIKTDSVNFLLGEYVALPTKVTIKALVAGEMKIIASDISPQSTRIQFPNYTSNQFIIEFEYSQPMRITEIKFNDLNEAPSTQSIRFLAEPNHSYTLFFDPQHSTYLNLGESANLSDDSGILKIGNPIITSNILFKETDSDQDGIVDIKDNCVQIANADQLDTDNNGRGDSCDDWDKDGIINSSDNCINNPNSDQIDIDRDGKGDACDSEESRITEKYPIIVWVAIVFAVLLFAFMFYIISKKKITEVSNPTDANTSN